MKKSIMVILALMGAVQILSAIPAKPGQFTRTLPDGRKITLQLHGDEFCHWMTDASGRVVKQDKNGFIVSSSIAEAGIQMGGSEEVNGARIRRQDQSRRMMRRAAPARGAAQELHFPMFLVQFPDLHFTVAETDELVRKAFDDLANQVGYSANGGTGSVHDYYVDNSMGQTDFYFDVFGPVTVSQSYAYYGTKQTSPETGVSSEPAAVALMEAVSLIAQQEGENVFNPYDNDGDGWVDAAFMFYAGHNEAEGAPEETIWPHEWGVYSWDYYHGTDYCDQVYGNVRFNTYSCTSERKGTPDYDGGMCGIGTAVHEFGHALGLPDLYDTNYNNYGDGQAGGVYGFSPMCNGSYNNAGRTPAYFTMEERIMMGWADDFTPMPASGTITLPSVDTNFAYKEETGNPGEYFIFECRRGTGWDSYVPKGMVVYHVDKSENEVRIYTSRGEYYVSTAADIWSRHRANINTWLEHPCYYAVPAVDQGNLAFGENNYAIPFPGDGDVTTYQWQGWAPENRQADLFYGITFNSANGTVTMHREGVDTGVTGQVCDKQGVPVANATVSVYAEYLPAGATLQAPAGGPAKIAHHVGLPVQTAETDADGRYLLRLEGLDVADEVSVEVSAPGYLTGIEHVSLTQRALVTRNVRLMGVGEPSYSSLSKIDGVSSYGFVGWGNGAKVMLAAIRFSGEELSAHAGKKITGLQFVYHVGAEQSASGVKGVIDFGEERVLVMDHPSPVPDTWNFLDVSGANLRVPADRECHFGYAIMDCTEGYPYNYSCQESVPGGLRLYYTDDESILETSYWWNGDDWGFGPLLISVVLEDGAVLQLDYISIPNVTTFAVGSTLDLNLVQVGADVMPESAISWFYDDEPVSGVVTFSRTGRHVLEARYTNSAGKRKVIEREITVQ